MRIDQLTPGDQVTLGFCLLGSSTNGRLMDEEQATFVRMEGEGNDRLAVFFSPSSENNKDGYKWEAYRYNGGWAYGTSANRLRLLRVDVPGLNIPEDFPVKVLRTPKERAAAKACMTCSSCGRSWDDGSFTSMTPAPSARCPFEDFHSEVHI